LLVKLTNNNSTMTTDCLRGDYDVSFEKIHFLAFGIEHFNMSK
jgi:hypothetical protein